MKKYNRGEVWGITDHIMEYCIKNCHIKWYDIEYKGRLKDGTEIIIPVNYEHKTSYSSYGSTSEDWRFHYIFEVEEYLKEIGRLDYDPDASLPDASGKVLDTIPF